MKIIAYGSLMNQKSLEKTLNRKNKLKKTLLSGYKRIFNAPFDGFAFLNLAKSRHSKIEVAYFEMNKKELIKFLKREKGSILKEIKNGYYAFIWPKNRCKKLPVLQSYIDVCAEGAKNLDIKLWRGTVNPEKIIDDRTNPKYC